MTSGLLIYDYKFAHFLIHVLGSPSSFMTLQLLPSECSYIIYEENCILFFISVRIDSAL
jgi:hypothetical protein